VLGVSCVGSGRVYGRSWLDHAWLSSVRGFAIGGLRVAARESVSPDRGGLAGAPGMEGALCDRCAHNSPQPPRSPQPGPVRIRAHAVACAVIVFHGKGSLQASRQPMDLSITGVPRSAWCAPPPAPSPHRGEGVRWCAHRTSLLHPPAPRRGAGGRGVRGTTAEVLSIIFHAAGGLRTCLATIRCYAGDAAACIFSRIRSGLPYTTMAIAPPPDDVPATAFSSIERAIEMHRSWEHPTHSA
jgi:hypothetical protein